MKYLGDFAEDATVRFSWDTADSDGASITRATDGTISVYKDGGTTQSTAGVTDTEDFDSLTGVHHCAVDTSADAFYATGSDYSVILSGATIDGQTVNATLAEFSIQNRYNPSAAANASLLQSTTIATLASQTSFTLTAGSSDDDAYNNQLIIITDSSTSTQKAVGRVSDYVGSTKTVTLDADPGVFTMAVGDTVDIVVQPNRVALVDTTTANSDMLSEAQMESACDAALATYDGPTDTEMNAAIDALDDVTEAQVLAKMTEALEAMELNHLFADAYNPASKPGVATGLLNQLVENDSGVPRFTGNALEQAPTASGSDGPTLLKNTTIATLASQTSFTLDAGSSDDDAYNNRTIIVVDSGDTNQVAVGRVSDYTGSTKTITLAADPGVFTMAVGDTVKILAMPGLTAAEVNAEADTAISDAGLDQVMSHLSSGTAQAGAAGTITLAASEPATADWYNNKRIVLTGGTGAKQSRLITDYTTGRVASVDSDWATTPDATTTYEIQPPEIVETSKANGRTVAITVQDTEVSPNDIENATVRMVASGFDQAKLTDSNGLATFYVDDATYTYTISKNNYAGDSGTIVVAGNVTTTKTMAQNGTPSAANPGMCNMTVTAFDEDGAVESGVSLTVTLKTMPTGTGSVGDKTPRTETTNGSGIATFTNLFQGGVYEIYRGNAPSSPTFGTAPSSVSEFTVPNSSTGEIKNFAGVDPS